MGRWVVRAVMQVFLCKDSDFKGIWNDTRRPHLPKGPVNAQRTMWSLLPFRRSMEVKGSGAALVVAYTRAAAGEPHRVFAVDSSRVCSTIRPALVPGTHAKAKTDCLGRRQDCAAFDTRHS